MANIKLNLYMKKHYKKNIIANSETKYKTRTRTHNRKQEPKLINHYVFINHYSAYKPGFKTPKKGRMI